MEQKTRCPYFELNDQERAYHDKEWGTPCRNDRKLFEYLMYEVLQCGLSWNTILLKRDAAYADFLRDASLPGNVTWRLPAGAKAIILDAAKASADPITRNKAAMRRFEKCINENDLALGRELISEKAAFATPVSPEPLHGAEGYLSVVSLMRASFPDVQWKLEDMVADEKTVAVRWTCTGTFTGKTPFAGIQPNGRKFSSSVMNFYVFDDEGKIIDDIAATGMLGILQGIGAK